MKKLSDIVVSGVTVHPPRVLLYGPPGVGKTHFGAGADNPIFIQTEEGADVVGPPRFPLAKTFADVKDAVEQLRSTEHDYSTVVIDSLDWTESLIWNEVCKAEKIENIEKLGYGKGYIYALSFWKELLESLNLLRDERKMAVLLIAHTHVKQFNDPGQLPYDRYEIKLHKHAAALCMENSDVVAFATYRMRVQEIEGNFGKKVTRAVGEGERIMCTQMRPAYVAKSRYPMDAEMDLSWVDLSKAISEGMKNGSSK